MNRTAITDEEREKVIEMFGENMDTFAIGKLLGVHESVVSRVLHEEREKRNVAMGDYETGQVKNYTKR